jgi:hypothetical protein
LRDEREFERRARRRDVHTCRSAHTSTRTPGKKGC